ncbi:endo-1,4-beta-xylanase [Catellatospora chokoriensis]|uniref:endo-1,4-beta-xylanase n=1 Tax=Catellatospora chokoriensis TaxID=310353 RepID=UPI00177E214C|nr:endo-1,4-beta-xylanase [Catellatospora chokoriensis]
MRRWSAAALVTLLQASTLVVGSPPAAADQPTLRQLAQARGIAFGSAVSQQQLAADTGYRDWAGAQLGLLVPETEFIWGHLQPSQLQGPNFDDTDQLVAFAESHGQQVRGHTLTWHTDLPSWLTRDVAAGVIGPEALKDLHRRHIESVVGRYRNRVSMWNVVNEPLAENGSLRTDAKTGFWALNASAPGDPQEYIRNAFHWAREADPDAKLYLNEYGAEWGSAKARGLYNLVKDLIAAGVPIDGIGFQTHAPVSSRLSGLEDTMRRFAALGLEVAITELDVRVPMLADSDELAQQAEVYGQAAKTCLSLAPACTSVTTWGFTDAHSWYPSSEFPSWGAATLLDASMNPKPAYHALSAVLSSWSRPTTSPVGWWRLDDWWNAGTAGGVATDASGRGQHATVTGPALGAPGRTPAASAFLGDGGSTQAKTTAAVLNTANSFTVSAWVSMSTRGQDKVVVSQDGATLSTVRLGYDAATDRWIFTVRDTNGTPVSVVSSAAPTLGTWTHLTGVWNKGWGRLLLYVDGKWQLQQATEIGALAAAGPAPDALRIGRSQTGDAWSGAITDVRAYDRAVPDAEVAQLADPVVGRWTFSGDPGDESWFMRDAWPREIDGCKQDPKVCNDNSVLHLTADRHGAGYSALALTGNHILDVRPTGLFADRSYTVSAWVKLGSKAADGVLMSQPLGDFNAFALKYQKSNDSWVFKGSSTSIGSPSAPIGQWTHLAAVWNAGWGRMQLYVNGVLTAQSGATTNVASTPGMTIGVSAEGGRLVGALDDLALYQRVLTPAEITALAQP